MTKHRHAPAPQAATAETPDPSLLTDAEADWVLARVVWPFLGDINGAQFKAVFGIGATIGVREDRRDAAREMVRAFVTVERGTR
jgi:hypothetical protein